MTKNKVNVAVIGIGRMGGRHALNLYRHRVEGATLSAVCDIDENALKFYKGKVKTFVDYKALIKEEKPDAVIIAVPHYSHGEIAKYCIENGVHTLVEKPLTVTTAEAKEVIECAEKYPKLTVAVMFNQRTNPLYSKAKKLIEDGALGEIRRGNYIVTDWYRSQAYYDQGGWRASYKGEGGGTLINQCVHQLDLIQWICGMPDWVLSECRTVNRKITTENDVTAVFGYDDGARISFSASTHELWGTNRMEISGDKGRILIEHNKLIFTSYKKDEKAVNEQTKFGYGFVARRKKVYRYYLKFLCDFKYGQQINIVRNFVATILNKTQLLSPVADGLNTVELINGSYLSAWENRIVKLPLDDKYYEIKLTEKVTEEDDK